MDKDAAKCDICRRPVVWPSHYGDWECPHCHQRYEYDEGLKITLTDAQWALLRNPPRWISVAERLPEKHTAVLVHTDMDGNHAASFDGEEWFCDYGGAWLFPNVTHWMPLPEPPEVK